MGLTGAALTIFVAPHLTGQTDFDQIWVGARILRQGGNPYLEIGPGRFFPWPWRLYYPLSALVLAAPLSFLPLSAARAIFVGVSSSLLAWLLGKRGISSLPVFASAAFFHAAIAVQWSPLLTAAALAPWLGFVFAAKPNFGAALWATYPSKKSVAGAVALATVSVVIFPSWPLYWLESLKTSHTLLPMIIRPGGFFLILAALRWRKTEGRLLLFLSLIPQTGVAYDMIPLFLIARSFRQGLLLALLVSISFFGSLWFFDYESKDAFLRFSAQLNLFLVYLPSLFLVLRGSVSEQNQERS